MADYEEYQAKRILNVHKNIDGGWFWVKYTASQYLGCEWGCKYCYSRDEKYNPYKKNSPEGKKSKDPFSEFIKIKKNAGVLLKRELAGKPVEPIYIDNYQPIEQKYKLSRKMLKVCLDLGFPVFINEKSPTLLRDLDIIKKIHKKSGVCVGWSIIGPVDDNRKKAFEPNTPPISARFDAMKQLANAGIPTGTVYMPLIPYIFDKDADLEGVIQKTKQAGGRFVLDGGLTLWGKCKDFFYTALEDFNPNLVAKFEGLYSDKRLFAEYFAGIHQKIRDICSKHDVTNYIPRPLKHYPEELMLNKKIAESFYLLGRELQLSAQGGYRSWAYIKAARSIDSLKESLKDIYQNQGIKGLTSIPNIGQTLAPEITSML